MKAKNCGRSQLTHFVLKHQLSVLSASLSQSHTPSALCTLCQSFTVPHTISSLYSLPVFHRPTHHQLSILSASLSQSHRPVNMTKYSRGYPHCPHSNAETLPQNMPPPCPSKSLPIYYSETILLNDATYSVLLTASLINDDSSFVT